jgi:hypothetical protein
LNETIYQVDANRVVKEVDKIFDRVQATRKAAGANALRSSTVKVVEIVLGASHEYFNPKFTPETEQEEWRQANLEWAKEYYKGRGIIVDGQVHRDERSDHWHIMFVPKTTKLDKKTGKTLPTFSAKEFMGNKVEMNKARTSHADAMAKFGLRRGRNYFKEGEKPPAYVKDMKQLRRKTASEIDALDISDIIDYISGTRTFNAKEQKELNDMAARKDKPALVKKASSLPWKPRGM